VARAQGRVRRGERGAAARRKEQAHVCGLQGRRRRGRGLYLPLDCGAACEEAHAEAHYAGCAAAATMLFTATFNRSEAGQADAQCDLGFYFEEGVGIAADSAEAAKWFTRAAEGGSNLARQYLDCINFGGDDGSSGYVKDYMRAAAAGNKDAQCNLGSCYRNGTGVAGYAAKAVELYTRAAEAGHPDAQCNLGLCYREGTGVAKNVAKAVE
jgi:TPR repeat protein